MVSNDTEGDQQEDSVKEIVKEIKMNPKKRKASKDIESKQVKRLKKPSQESESDDDEEYVL